MRKDKRDKSSFELPPGCTILRETEPDPKAVTQMLRELSWGLTPRLRRKVERIIKRREKEMRDV